jgi:repressor of nif and glnA expression
MSRVTEADVKAIIETDITPLTVFIDQAALLVSEVLEGKGLSEARLKEVERYLAAGANLQESQELQGVDVRVITGSDYTGVLDQPRAANDTTSTTVPLAPTTTAPPAPDC